jgi:fimbrial chaperone protein
MGIICYFLFFLPTLLFSWFVTPGRVIINPESGTSFITVVASGDDEQMPIDLYTATRSVDIDGSETFEKIKGAFHIIPSQFMLRPGERKFIRVIWRGDKKLQKEQAYRLVIQGVPITDPMRLEKDGIVAQIAHKRRYVCPLYVKPKHTRPKLKLLSFKKMQTNDEEFLELKMKNTGNAHKYLKKFNLKFINKDNTSSSHQLLFSDIQGSNLILSNHERIIKIKWSKKFPGNFTKIELSSY